VLAAAFAQGFIELFEQLLLVLGELDRRFHRDVAVQVARVAAAHAFDAFAAQAELLAGLRALRDVDGGFAAQRGHFDLATECCFGEADRHRTVQVIAIALKDLVLLDADLDVQVAGWATVGAGLAVAAGSDAHAVVDARRDLHFQRFLFLDLAFAVAGAARVGNDLAGAPAVRAGLLHAEKALAHLHRARAMAGRAGAWRWCRAWRRCRGKSRTHPSWEYAAARPCRGPLPRA